MKRLFAALLIAFAGFVFSAHQSVFAETASLEKERVAAVSFVYGNGEGFINFTLADGRMVTVDLKNDTADVVLDTSSDVPAMVSGVLNDAKEESHEDHGDHMDGHTGDHHAHGAGDDHAHHAAHHRGASLKMAVVYIASEEKFRSFLEALKFVRAEVQQSD